MSDTTTGRCPCCGQRLPALNTTEPVLLTMRQVAELIGRPLRTLEKWRLSWLPAWQEKHPRAAPRVGPEPLETDAGIRYDAQDVAAWLEAHTPRAVLDAAKTRNAGRRDPVEAAYHPQVQR